MCVLLTIYGLISPDIDAIESSLCDIQLLPPVIAKGIFWSPWPLTVTCAIQCSAIDLSISNRLSSENSGSGSAGFFPNAWIFSELKVNRRLFLFDFF